MTRIITKPVPRVNQLAGHGRRKGVSLETIENNYESDCEQMRQWAMNSREAVENYLPHGDDKALPDEGAWIQVIIPPICENTVEPLSCFYALPVYKADEWKLVHEFKSRYKVRILTPDGELQLYAEEYTVLSRERLDAYLMEADGDHVTLRWLDPTNEDFVADRLFYIMSKGIRKHDAYAMLLGEISSQNVCFLTFHLEYQRLFAGTGSKRINARRVVNVSIDNQLMEKAAGRWYAGATKTVKQQQQTKGDRI